MSSGCSSSIGPLVSGACQQLVNRPLSRGHRSKGYGDPHFYSAPKVDGLPASQQTEPIGLRSAPGPMLLLHPRGTWRQVDASLLANIR